MANTALPTPWNVYNLAQSPFFQQPLESGERTSRPLSLFVGRGRELKRLRGTIHGAGGNATVQAIAGAPGVGKTTLVKELKALALADGYLTTDSYVAIQPSDTPADLFGRVLGALYDTMLANRPQSGDNPAMADAKLLVRTTRLTSFGVSLPIPGVGGAGGSRGTSVVLPKDILIDGPRIMRDLTRMIEGSDARGVLLHLNNLENLSDADAGRAAETLRALRDVMLLQNGLHYVVVGTTDAVNAAVNSYPQVRSVVSTLALDALTIDEVLELLDARYQHLRVERSKPAIAPVATGAVAAIYGFFRGDLRGLLKALEDGVTPLIGLDDSAARPLAIDELRPVLQQRYTTELNALPEQKRVSQLIAWGRTAPDSVQTQKSLGVLWGVSQGTVSPALAYLIRQGYVLALPRSSGTPTQYMLSGVSRLIFG
ncbi:MAG: ATP-binding protein [Gemmatimonadaceae bacterium]|nr:ATP-binding protein [Gemmatimonadaceae bacterium]NUQ91668.1 ATP-binding protein [Gemmatimonadaceae bacterium]NUR35742.1 ATP-binding protein [Gemmatimonadaceae bacterium]NUS96601.1 ATP-binding protein [Gemmatimonadaceae bacterium]